MGNWWWIAVVIVIVVLAVAGMLVRAARNAPAAAPRRAYVPDEERCEEPVDTGDERCPERATERFGNKRLCVEHLRYHESWRG